MDFESLFIDNVVITTSSESTLIDDFRKTFDNLDKYHMKPNPAKCSFGVPTGPLLRFLVSTRGFKANPKKNQAILMMDKLTKLHEIQQLAGRVVFASM
jgi:hypothetical protein